MEEILTFANDYGANQICMDLDNDKVYKRQVLGSIFCLVCRGTPAGRDGRKGKRDGKVDFNYD